MKMLKKITAALLLLLFLCPTAAVSAQQKTAAANELEIAQQLALVLKNGGMTMTASVQKDFDFERCLEYTRMLYPDYYGLTWSWDTRGEKAILRVDMEDRAKHIRAQEEASQIVKKLKAKGLSETELLRAFHDTLIERCEYDYEAYLNMEIAGAEPFSAYGALLGGRAVCDGYSAAFAMLCAAADIPCIFVSAPELNHSWNAVFTDGQILFVDVTYDEQKKSPSYEHFLKAKAEFLASHKGWNTAECDKVCSAIWPRHYDSARILYRLGLFKGSDKGFELTRQPRRDEAAVMLTRFLGLEKEVHSQGSQSKIPFDDVSAFYKPYVALLYEKGLTSGTSLIDRTYSPAVPVTAQQYMTFMLRSLGYSDKQGDFVWSSALEKAVSLGILSKSEVTEIKKGAFTRGVMAFLSVKTLNAHTKQGIPLYQQLVADGVLNAALVKEVL